MRTRIGRTAGQHVAIAVALTIGLVAGSAVAAGPKSPGGAGIPPPAATLQGSWRVEITVRHCLTGDVLLSPFPALATFAQGGTVTTSDGGMSPAARGTGLGLWQRLGGRTFAARTEAFTFSPAGTLSGRQRITQEITLDHDGATFEARVSSEVVNTMGQVVFTGCATSVGRRLD